MGRPTSVPSVAARLLVVVLLLWAVGAALVQVAFLATGASPWVELADGSRRGQAIWIGAQCLVAAGSWGAAVLGVLSAVDFSDSREGRRRTLIATVADVAVALAAVAVVHDSGLLDRVLTLGLGGAVLIGAAAGLGIVWWRAEADREISWLPEPPAAPAGRAWGSRGR